MLLRETFLKGSIFCCFLLAGCTPAPKQIVGVERMEGGVGKVLIAPCPGYVAQLVGISAHKGAPRWSVWNSPGTRDVSEVEFFRAPDGWRVSKASLADLKTGDVTFSAGVMGGIGGRGLNGDVTFDLKRFEGLGDGEVIVGNNKVVRRTDFMKVGSGRCEP
ncbi:hypothetical protein [Streptomyces sp. Isolate_45]|uniref:hypothetical protein n=1 Tax=Streptomyces sp. Isolate_45 TaxID=2950111 RepID=UPI002481B80F|nr:hypothetical protein [Streptomyces sp. Isolate_45]MDA5281983.1 hypothetical protein [Streptomyces sp. Isolate_45]